MVSRNLSEALRIALVPVLIGFALIAGLTMMTGLSLGTFSDEVAMKQAMTEGGASGLVLPIFLIVIVLVIIELWVFVSWHRFILLEEYPSGWIPEFRFERIMAYAGNGLLIFFILFLTMIPVGLVALTVVSALSFAPFLAAMLVSLGAPILGYLVFYRLSPKLPAAAVGTSMKLGEAWGATKGATGTLLVTGLSTAIVQFVLQYVAGLSLAVFLPLGMAFQLLTALVMSLVNVSILTTIYGHYVEGREIG